MTDKGIIVDGIDVSECECFIEKMDFPNNLEGGYYNQNNLCECGVQGVESYPFFCKDNSNCYYKQLKAKNTKIYKTLTEIKEIADKDFRHTAWEEYAKQLKQIRQKISDAENE